MVDFCSVFKLVIQQDMKVGVPMERKEKNGNLAANARPAGMSEDEREDNFLFEVLTNVW